MNEMPGIVPCRHTEYTAQPIVLTTVSRFEFQSGEETQVSEHAKSRKQREPGLCYI